MVKYTRFNIMPPTKHSRFREHASPAANVRQKTKNRKKSLKDQLRSVQRLLHQEDLPATVRVAQERILNMLQETLKEKAKENKERKMAKKYKMVKFFEKRKVARKYKMCVKSLNTCSEQTRESLEEEQEELKQQWNYITYFPNELKYISLFPPSPCNNSEILKKKEKILKMINDKVSSGEMDDTTYMMSQSPKEKPNRKSRSPGSRLKIGADEQTDHQQADETQKISQVDDFFIDTSPGKKETKGTKSSKVDNSDKVTTETLKFPVLGFTDKSSHKIKRLKDTRDVEATKKAKKNKKNKEKGIKIPTDTQ